MDEQMFCHDILLHRGKDGKDKYRAEYNRLLADYAKDTGNVLEQKHLVVSTNKRNIKETRDRLRQVQGNLVSALSSLGCTVRTVSNNDRLQVLHNFFGAGKEQHFRFDLSECRRLGHDFRDYVSPDTMAFKSDHIEIDHRFAKAMGMVQYPQKLDDKLFATLLQQALYVVLSIDVVPVESEDAYKEIEADRMKVDADKVRFDLRQENLWPLLERY